MIRFSNLVVTCRNRNVCSFFENFAVTYNNVPMYTCR